MEMDMNGTEVFCRTVLSAGSWCEANPAYSRQAGTTARISRDVGVRPLTFADIASPGTLDRGLV
jgi:hypothetical protein